MTTNANNQISPLVRALRQAVAAWRELVLEKHVVKIFRKR